MTNCASLLIPTVCKIGSNGLREFCDEIILTEYEKAFDPKIHSSLKT